MRLSAARHAEVIRITNKLVRIVGFISLQLLTGPFTICKC